MYKARILWKEYQKDVKHCKRKSRGEKGSIGEMDVGRFQLGNQHEGFSSTTVNKQPWHSEQNKDFPNHRATYLQKHTTIRKRKEKAATRREGEKTKLEQKRSSTVF